jgi:small subunit ribosomal protein S16
MLKICLSVRGKKGQRSFRVIIKEDKKKRDTGNYVTDVGFYNAKNKEVRLDKEIIKKYLSYGAQPTATVCNLLKKHL